MKILILSCATGGGHNAAGYAIAEKIQQQGDEAYVFDYLSMAGEKVSQRVGGAYVGVVKHTPLLFGAAYHVAGWVSRLVSHSPIYYVNGRMAKYLYAYLKENTYDAIVMPHLYPAETITYMKRQGISLPLTVAVATDYTCIPFWGETDCDYYVIPHRALAEEFEAQGIPGEKLLPYGIPVSVRFEEKVSRNKARELLGLPKDKKLYLIVGGSMGAGNIIRLTRTLHEMLGRDEGIVVICGNNKKVQRRLRKICRKVSNVDILGSVDQMELYMKACDVVYTKPGGLTSTEAAVSGVPIVHTTPIPGCETKNRKFFIRRNMSAGAKTINGQAAAGIRLADSPRKRMFMKQAQNKYINREASMKIYEFLKKKTERG